MRNLERTWHGVRCLLHIHWNSASLVVLPQSRTLFMTLVASGSWGCGACHEKDLFQMAWEWGTQGLHIAAKEFIPIIIGEVVWGKARKSGRVVAYCDNSAVVAVMNWRYDHDATAALLPFFFFLWRHTSSFKYQHHILQACTRNWQTISLEIDCHHLEEARCKFGVIRSSNCPLAVASQQPGMDLSSLAATVHYFCSQRVAPSARSTYQSSMCKIAEFCSLYHHFQFQNPYCVILHARHYHHKLYY